MIDTNIGFRVYLLIMWINNLRTIFIFIFLKYPIFFIYLLVHRDLSDFYNQICNMLSHCITYLWKNWIFDLRYRWNKDIKQLTSIWVVKLFKREWSWSTLGQIKTICMYEIISPCVFPNSQWRKQKLTLFLSLVWSRAQRTLSAVWLRLHGLVTSAIQPVRPISGFHDSIHYHCYVPRHLLSQKPFRCLLLSSHISSLVTTRKQKEQR